jgi:hypothetical protein
MTLKERILPLVADGSYVEITASTIEKIADEFAIGFAEWKNKGCYCNDILTKELLEIYKKEKGL